MTENSKAPTEGGVRASQRTMCSFEKHSTEFHQTNQAIRLPSATRYYLKRYRDDLSPHAEHGNDDAVIMMSLCDALLESADMLERGASNG